MFKTLENKRKTFHNFFILYYIFRPFFHLNHFVAIFKVLWATQILILYLAWVIFQSIKLKEKRLQNFSSFYFLVYTLVEEFQKLKSIILRVSNWKSSICFLKDFFSTCTFLLWWQNPNVSERLSSWKFTTSQILCRWQVTLSNYEWPSKNSVY